MITLKDVKVHDDVSEETTCFSAMICEGDRTVGNVRNDGHGGCNTYYWNDREAEKRIFAWAEKQPTEFAFEKLDQIIGDLVTKALTPTMPLGDAAACVGRFLAGGSKRFPHWVHAVARVLDPVQPVILVVVKGKLPRNATIPKEWGGYPVRTVDISDLMTEPPA